MSGANTRANKVQKTIGPARQPARELIRQPGRELIRQQEQGPVQALAPQAAYRRVQLNRNGLRPADLLVLQRAVGNRAVQRMVAKANDEQQDETAEEDSERTVQTKLTAGAAKDIYEQEADRVARRVMTVPKDATQQPNRTGLPDGLKSGVESLSGISMEDVKVHYHSSQPAQLNALAYTQGSDIHVAAGQEQHLPHEAWHVVQQAQGRVQPTMQLMEGVLVNDDLGLEREADVMGARARQTLRHAQSATNASTRKTPVAREGKKTTSVAEHADASAVSVAQRGVGTTGPIVQCWTEEEVYTAVRESLPAWRMRVKQIEAGENEWKRRDLSKELLRELSEALAESRKGPLNGYRLGRTYEYAEGAVNAIVELQARTQMLLSEAQDHIRNAVYHAIDEYDRLEAEVSKRYQQMSNMAKKLGVKYQVAEVDEDVRKKSAEAEQNIRKKLEPERSSILDLNGALEAELMACEGELRRLERLEANQPQTEELQRAMKDEYEYMVTIRELLKETTYKSRILGDRLKRIEPNSKELRKKADRARTLSDPSDVALLPQIIAEYDEHIETVKELGKDVEEAHERSTQSKGGSASARPITWVHQTAVAKISEKAYEGLKVIGCSDVNIMTALENLKNAAPGEWNVIKDLGKGVFELKVLGSGKYRCESTKNTAHPIEFKNAPKKGAGK